MSLTTQAAVQISVHIRNHLDLYRPQRHTDTHTQEYTHTYTNSVDGIWLCDLSWGSLLLNPLNALGIPAFSFPSVSLLHIPPSVLLHGWMNTYHLSDKEPSTLVLTLSWRAMFRAQTRPFTDALWLHLPDQPRRECCSTATVFQLGQLAVVDQEKKIFYFPFFPSDWWGVRRAWQQKHPNQSLKTSMNWTWFHWELTMFWKETRTKWLRGSTDKNSMRFNITACHKAILCHLSQTHSFVILWEYSKTIIWLGIIQ